MGDRLGVSPVIILLSLLLWGMIWGIPGALLSTPIVSIIKIVCENIPSLHSIAVLMGSGDFVMNSPNPPEKSQSAKIPVITSAVKEVVREKIRDKIANAAKKISKKNQQDKHK